MPATRRLLLPALALTAGLALSIGLPPAAGAAPNSAPAPRYVIHFTAIARPGAPTGLRFHSTSCIIGPASNPIVVICHEKGTIKFTTTGGSGTARVSSALAGISWRFTLVRGASTATDTYRMVGKGTESIGTSPVLRPVKVTGTLTVELTPNPTFHGTEHVHALPTSAA
jgi:hypothetical protein